MRRRRNAGAVRSRRLTRSAGETWRDDSEKSGQRCRPKSVEATDPRVLSDPTRRNSVRIQLCDPSEKRGRSYLDRDQNIGSQAGKKGGQAGVGIRSLSSPITSSEHACRVFHSHLSWGEVGVSTPGEGQYAATAVKFALSIDSLTLRASISVEMEQRSVLQFILSDRFLDHRPWVCTDPFQATQDCSGRTIIGISNRLRQMLTDDSVK